MILFAYRILTFFSHLSRKLIGAHKVKNEEVWQAQSGRYLERLPDKKSYVEHQGRMKNLLLGKWFGKELPASYNSCEVISIYNAMVSEGVIGNVLAEEQGGGAHPDFPALLAAFEKKGLALNGFFGASPASVEKYLKKNGYATRRLNGEKRVLESLPEMEEGCRTWIVTFQNNRDRLRDQVHTMCINRQGREFILHNDYSGGKNFSRYRSLGDVMLGYNEGKAKVISLIGVKKG